MNSESCSISQDKSLPQFFAKFDGLESQSSLSSGSFTTYDLEILPNDGKSDDVLALLRRLKTIDLQFMFTIVVRDDGCRNSNDFIKSHISRGLQVPTILLVPHINERGSLDAVIVALSENSAAQAVTSLALVLQQNCELRRNIPCSQLKYLLLTAAKSLLQELQIAALAYRIAAERKMMESRRYLNRNADVEKCGEGGVQLGPRLPLSVTAAVAAKCFSSQITSNRSISELLSTKIALGR